MKSFEKESLFWFEISNVLENQMESLYLLNMNKEVVLDLMPITLIGLHQYCLYTGECIDQLNDDEFDKYSDYILKKYNEIYKMKYNRIKEKPKRLNLDNEESFLKAKKIIESITLPFYKKNGLKTLNSWKEISRAYIANMLSIYEYDLNHESDDGKLKTSNVYPFLFSLNLINNGDIKGLYTRVITFFDRKKILRSYESGREWKQKEIDYLSSTLDILKSEEEWQLFLSNFAFDKWNDFSEGERYKTLFQLSKFVSILLKEKITSISMLENGFEIKDILKNYLPLFINQDKLDCQNHLISTEVINKYDKTLTPFYNFHLNLPALINYLEVKKEYFTNINIDLLKSLYFIAISVISKLKSMIISQEYFPEAVDILIAQKKKIFIDILGVFSYTEKENNFKKNMNVNNYDLDNYFINEEEIQNMLTLIGVKKPVYHAYSGFIKLGKIISFLLGINAPTAKVFNYDLKEIIKYIFIIFGPHKMDYVVQKQTVIDNVTSLFFNFCEWYEKQDAISKSKLISILDLPTRLKNFKKK